MTKWNKPSGVDTDWSKPTGVDTSWGKPSGVDTDWTKPDGIASTIETTELLQENGDNLLQENGETILSTFWSGFRKIVNGITTIWK